MYKHYDNDDSLISLHDCHAEKISFSNGTLSFYFPDGFWIPSNHPENQINTTVRTDASRIDYHLLNEEIGDIYIYIFNKIRRGNVIRGVWEPTDFIDAVNDGSYRVEFIHKYTGYQSLLYKCWVWFDRKPWHKECEIIIPTDSITYCWNQICENRV